MCTRSNSGPERAPRRCPGTARSGSPCTIYPDQDVREDIGGVHVLVRRGNAIEGIPRLDDVASIFHSVGRGRDHHVRTRPACGGRHLKLIEVAKIPCVPPFQFRCRPRSSTRTAVLSIFETSSHGGSRERRCLMKQCPRTSPRSSVPQVRPAPVRCRHDEAARAVLLPICRAQARNATTSQRRPAEILSLAAVEDPPASRNTSGATTITSTKTIEQGDIEEASCCSRPDRWISRREPGRRPGRSRCPSRRAVSRPQDEEKNRLQGIHRSSMKPSRARREG